jgi:hypothetical protein
MQFFRIVPILFKKRVHDNFFFCHNVFFLGVNQITGVSGADFFFFAASLLSF